MKYRQLLWISLCNVASGAPFPLWALREHAFARPWTNFRTAPRSPGNRDRSQIIEHFRRSQIIEHFRRAVSRPGARTSCLRPDWDYKRLWKSLSKAINQFIPRSVCYISNQRMKMKRNRHIWFNERDLRNGVIPLDLSLVQMKRTLLQTWILNNIFNYYFEGLSQA